jgi:hypothetical protein
MRRKKYGQKPPAPLPFFTFTGATQPLFTLLEEMKRFFVKKL